MTHRLHVTMNYPVHEEDFTHLEVTTTEVVSKMRYYLTNNPNATSFVFVVTQRVKT